MFSFAIMKASGITVNQEAPFAFGKARKSRSHGRSDCTS